MSNLKPPNKERKVRNKNLVKLHDEGITFYELGRKYKIRPSRAQVIYAKEKYKETNPKYGKKLRPSKHG